VQKDTYDLTEFLCFGTLACISSSYNVGEISTGSPGKSLIQGREREDDETKHVYLGYIKFNCVYLFVSVTIITSCEMVYPNKLNTTSKYLKKL